MTKLKSLLGKIKKIAPAAALTLATAGPSYAQCTPKYVNEGLDINGLEIAIGNTTRFVNSDQQIELPYNSEAIIRVPSIKRKRPSLDTAIVSPRLEVYRFIDGDFRIVRDSQGNVYNPGNRINPEEFNVRDGEVIRVSARHIDLCSEISNFNFYIVQGYRPAQANAQASAPSTNKPSIVQSTKLPTPQIAGEAKIVGLMGDETLKFENKENSNAIKGLFAQGIIKGNNFMGWAGVLSTNQEVEYVGSGGAQINRAYKILNAGITGRFAKVIVAEFEAINSYSGWAADRTPLLREIVDEASYKSYFFSGGLILPSNFTRGFRSPVFLQANVGIGKGTQNLNLTDHLYRNITYSSISLDEFFGKVILKSPYIDITASMGSFESTQETRGDNPLLKGSRSNLAVTGKFPLNKNIDIIGMAFIANTKYEDRRGLETQVGANWLGAGVNFKF